MRVVTTCEPYSRRGNLIQLAPAPRSHRSKDKEESLTLDERAVCASVGAEPMLANCPKNVQLTCVHCDFKQRSECGGYHLDAKRQVPPVALRIPYSPTIKA